MSPSRTRYARLLPPFRPDWLLARSAVDALAKLLRLGDQLIEVGEKLRNPGIRGKRMAHISRYWTKARS